ncbi:hypothetical protein [Crocosphaera sp.]|uniref:hypothetical protein n=1 Tax=Crocosphaera sp. TaxID=2729996 RepID=UPI003F26122E|nr:hypothetical protein [Crocosphaera sp.]
MKTVQVDEINSHLLSQENEPIAIESKGHLLGYFYPASYKTSSSDMDEKWERLEKIINQAAKESNLDPDVLMDVLDPSQPFPFESKSMAS